MQSNETAPSKINSASLIDLKAELFRKQEEYKAQKLANQNEGYIKGKPSTSHKKPSIWSKKNKGVSERAEKDYEEKLEEEDVFEKSKRSLETKARMYDKIAHGSDIPEEDGSNFFLVDFQKKVIDDKQDRRRRELREKEAKQRQDEEEEDERRLSEQPIPEPETQEEEWVDYTDSLGRSRRCLRADLPSLQKQDQQLQNSKREKNGENDLMSNDMRREKERQEWEKEEEDKMVAEKKGPIHYGDVLHKEIRSHGVAFYKFDTDESMRQEQMDELLKLREQTKDERSKSERIKAKRKAALAARLSKVKQRKREKLGLPEEEEKDDSEDEIGPKLGEAVEEQKDPEPLTRDDEWRKNINSTREWDKGKLSFPEKSEQDWLEKQRKERLDDFAPPSFYYNEKVQPARKSGTFNSLFNSDGSRTDSGQTPDCVVKDMIGKQLSDIMTEMDKEPNNTSSDNASTRNSDEISNNLNPTARIIGNLFKPSAVSHGNFSEPVNQNMTGYQPFSMAPPAIFENSYRPMDIHEPPPPPPPSSVIDPPTFQEPSIPYQHMSTPPPFHDMSVPPPQINQALPHQPTSAPHHFQDNFSALPLYPQTNSNTASFPVNMSVPPPPLQVPMQTNADMTVPPPSWTTSQSTGVAKQEGRSAPEDTPSVGVSVTSSASASEIKPKFVPRMSVIDRRFIESDDVN